MEPPRGISPSAQRGGSRFGVGFLGEGKNGVQGGDRSYLSGDLGKCRGLGDWETESGSMGGSARPTNRKDAKKSDVGRGPARESHQGKLQETMYEIRDLGRGET